VSTQLVGQKISRSEDQRLLRGLGRYVDDFEHHAAHAAFVRSDQAHARIVDVDVSGALGIEGVYAIYTFEDLEGGIAEPLPVIRPHQGMVSMRTPFALARDEVHYAGQPVAMVVARDRYVAEDAASAVRVTYEPLPAVVDLGMAARGEPGTAHSDMDDNLAGTFGEEVGDVDAALAGAPHVFELRLQMERAAAMPMETRAVVARYDTEANRLLLYVNTQAPLPLRAGLASIFGLDVEDVEVVAPDIGGGFGVKVMYFYPEEVLVPMASRRLGVPVKWTEDRREHFICSNHMRKQIHDVRVGCDDEGRILGIEFRYLHDTGAYSQYGLQVPMITSSHLSGPYRIENLRYEFRSIFTNTVQVSPCRGAGVVYAVFAMERTLDHVARELGLDRAEVRRKNLIQADEFPYEVGVTFPTGGPTVYDSGDYQRGLALLLESIGYEGFEEERRRAAAEGRRIGIGLACYVEATGPGPYEGAKVNVLPDGSVTVSTGATPAGQGHETAFAQIVADQLGVPLGRISVTTGDSRRMQYGFGTYASRSAVVAGNAALKASREVRRKAAELAANMLEASPDDMVFEDGMVGVAGVPQARVPLGGLAQASQYIPPGEGQAPGLSAIQYHSPQTTIFGNGMHAAVVEVDPDTYDTKILKYAVVHDCGRVINPMLVEGQVLGGVAQGIGGALYERIAYDEAGQIQNASFLDFMIPYSTEVPAVELHHTETPSPTNELGVKGAGEAGTIPVSAAISSALEDALGKPVDRMPVSPLDLFEMAEGEGGADGAPTESADAPRPTVSPTRGR
jgi:CO/xanthine dehydrogenase Mo-binding subunit